MWDGIKMGDMSGMARTRAAKKKVPQKDTPARRGARKKRRHTLEVDLSPLLLSVEEAAAKIRVSRAQMYRIVAAGKIETCKVGYLRRITVQALEGYVASLPRW